MSKRRTYVRCLSVILTLVMVLGLLPAAVRAEAPVEMMTAEHDHLTLSKGVALADDGTYTVQLEAYATGTQIPKSTDIVLVLDVSGSMQVPDYETGGEKALSLYTTYVSDAYRLYTQGIQFGHRDLVYVTGQGYQYKYYEMELTATTDSSGATTVKFYCPYCEKTICSYAYSDTTDQSLASSDNVYIYTSAITRLAAMQNAAKEFITQVASKNAEGAGHKIAIVTYSTDATLVQELTDSQTTLTTAIDGLTATGATRADLGLQTALTALTGSTADNRMVILLTDGVPTSGLYFENAVASDAVTAAAALEAVSNTSVYSISIMDDSRPEDDPTSSATDVTDRYLHAVSSNYPDAKVTDSASFTVDFGTRAPGDYYKKATAQDALKDIFSQIVNNVLDTVDLDANAVLKDVLNTGFRFTDHSAATVQTADYLGGGSWATPQSQSYTCTIDQAANTITVTGFSYKDNYVSDTPVNGRKLIVTITGVEAKDAAITNGYVYTNDPSSGIYKNNSALEALAPFPHPAVMLTTKTYVMDYAGTVALPAGDYQQSTLTHIDADGMHGFTTPSTGAELTYGKVQIDGNKTSLLYTAQSMQWDGYDSFYVFGKNADGTKNLWSKINVLPANNVYYEDTFVTSEENGTVGIVYSGDWSTIGESVENALTTVDTSGGKSPVFERVTSVENITDGDYVLVVKNGDGTYSGEYNTYALTNNQLEGRWMQAMGADGYMGASGIADSIRVEDNSVIWTLKMSNGTFTLTDSTGKTLYHNNSGNELTVSDSSASAWTPSAGTSAGTFYLRDMADSGRYLALRDDETAGGADDYGQPKFRCKLTTDVTSAECFEFVLYRRKPAGATKEVSEPTTNYQLVTDAKDITDGKYVLIVKVGDSTYTGNETYYALTKEELLTSGGGLTSWVRATGADSYMNGTVPNQITVTDDAIIWVLKASDGTFTLTDGADTALSNLNSGNELRYRNTTATAWKATSVTTADNFAAFYLQNSATNRYLALRDDSALDSDDCPRFRCTANNTGSGTASASCYQFYLYRQVFETVSVPVESDNGNAVHGWEESYGDDATFSGGSAHQGNAVGASATFTFTGTGVDVYSRTYNLSGRVFAQLRRVDDGILQDADGNVVTSLNFIVDERAFSGDYYQIPTLTFSDLEYGTYQVLIVVMANPVEGKDPIYYLDGIRVYNPLGTTTDPVVKDAYGNELNASFREVRDILIDANSFGNTEEVTGAVFLDRVGTVEDGTNNFTSSEMGQYVDYGPKNEVYLAPGQAIVFRVTPNEALHYFIGLKAPAGATGALVTNGAEKKELTISGASDLYYEIVPDENGNILVQNSGDALLSITKLRTTDPTSAGSAEIQTASLLSLMRYADSFDALPLTTDASAPVIEDTTGGSPMIEDLVQHIRQQLLDQILDMASRFHTWFR